MSKLFVMQYHSPVTTKVISSVKGRDHEEAFDSVSFLCAKYLLAKHKVLTGAASSFGDTLINEQTKVVTLKIAGCTHWVSVDEVLTLVDLETAVDKILKA